MRRLLFVVAVGLAGTACTLTPATEMPTSTVHDLSTETVPGTVGGVGGNGSSTSGSEGVEDVTAALRDAIFGGQTLSETEFVTLRDELIIPCMAEQGFQYVPTPLPGPEILTYSIVPIEDRREFVEEFGYGVTTLYWEQEQQWALMAATYEDPNEEIRGSLSDAERNAYDQALLGPVVEVVQSGKTGSEGNTTNEGAEPLVLREDGQGCRQQAETRIRGADLSVLEEETRAVVDEIWERIFADVRVIDADEDWHTCMAETGFPVEQLSIPGYRSTGESLVLSMMDELLAGATWTSESLVTDDGEAVELEVPVFDEDELAEVQEQELAIALADLDCDEQIGRSHTFNSVRAEFEMQVIEEHFTELSETLVDIER